MPPIIGYLAALSFLSTNHFFLILSTYQTPYHIVTVTPIPPCKRMYNHSEGVVMGISTAGTVQVA